MSEATTARALSVALATTLALQSVASMAMVAPSVLAPAVANELGVAPQRIGVFVSAAYLGAMISGLVCGGLIGRYGVLRVCMLSGFVCAAGLCVGASGLLGVILAAAFAIGFGYGLVNPVSSHILVRATPPRMMSFVFSLKQTGVPIGGAIAGALVPPLLIAAGWRVTIVVLAIACALVSLAIGVAGRAGFAPATPESPPNTGTGAIDAPPLGGVLRRAFGGLGAPIRLIAARAELRELAAVSFIYATMQLALFTYLVSYLHLELGHSLVAAGLVFAAAQIAGIVGRIAWGWLADRGISARAMLGFLGVTMAASGIAAAVAAREWSTAALTLTSVVFGASAVGWNGVYLAEVARRAPAGEVGQATGGTQFFTFLGALLGPPAFGLIVSATGRYAWGYAAFAVLPLVIGVWLLASRGSRK